MDTDVTLVIASSLAIGLLVGIERERSHRRAVDQAAGSRTFALLALSGTLAASLGTWVIAAGLVTVGALLVVSYLRTSADDPGATTEIAAGATYLIGALAWSDSALAAGVAIAMIVLLSAKDRIHTFARTVVTDADVDDAVRFLVMAFVVLPLLPDRDLGPYDVLNPQRIWQLVVALTAISWAGYVAVRVFGAKRGLPVAGLAGGFISATATTASMADRARRSGDLGGAVVGAQLASVATLAQLAAIVAVADASLMGHLWPALVAGSVVLVAIAAFSLFRPPSPRGAGHQDPGHQDTGHQDTGHQDTGHEGIAAGRSAAISRPFGLWPALVLASVLTTALLLGRWLADVFGPSGTVAAAGAAGLADAHAGALAAATLHDRSEIETSTALLAIGVALSVNTVSKCVLAFGVGGRRFGFRFAGAVLPAYAVFLGAVAAAALAA